MAHNVPEWLKNGPEWLAMSLSGVVWSEVKWSKMLLILAVLIYDANKICADLFHRLSFICQCHRAPISKHLYPGRGMGIEKDRFERDWGVEFERDWETS